MAEETEYKHGEIVDVDISEEMKKSYLDYAMSVIVSRAIPDVCDGLKPVHRRIIYSMYECGYEYNKPFKKCARIVGDVMGKYHPHGDSSIYEALVRMAQDFSMGVKLINGQGNFGSIDNDPPAAMRYTEARMEKITSMMIDDIDKDTVDFMPNYDGTENEPTVLPARFPNLLVNGSAGIAVGMATNIPPHNLSEVINGVIAYIDNPNITIEELVEIIPAPDFPTNCLILGKGGYLQAARTGRGAVIMRGETEIEEKKGRESIIIKSIPYQVNKAELVSKIAELVKDKKIEGISDLRDESSKEGIRIVVELKKDAMSDVILNQLYSYTQLQCNFSVNMLALNKGKPELLNLLDVIKLFTEFREEVVTRRTEYLLQKDRERAHILIGLRVAVDSIDEIIKLIKSSKDTTEARNELMARPWSAKSVVSLIDLIEDRRNKVENGQFYFTEEQARAILDMKLSKLTGLESEKIDNEINEVAERIKEYLSILSNREKLMGIIKEELLFINENFGEKRKSQIVQDNSDIDVEDLIPKEDMVIITTVNGYIKRIPLSNYKAQNRGGKGKSGISIHEEDLTSNIFIADTHTPILFFSNKGIVYRLKTYKLPLGGNNSKGRAIVNLLNLNQNEKITTIIPINDRTSGYLLMATKNGLIKKTPMTEFERINRNGKFAINLLDGDELIGVALTDGTKKIILASDNGRCIHFNESQVRSMGRTAKGVRGMKLINDAKVVDMTIVDDEDTVIVVSELGIGKRMRVADIRTTKRGGKGVKAGRFNTKTGKLVCLKKVTIDNDTMLVSLNGTVIRIHAEQIGVFGRMTYGVKIMNVRGDNVVASVAVTDKFIESECEVVENANFETVDENDNLKDFTSDDESEDNEDGNLNDDADEVSNEETTGHDQTAELNDFLNKKLSVDDLNLDLDDEEDTNETSINDFEDDEE